jgi:tol-pal system protein YbgF
MTKISFFTLTGAVLLALVSCAPQAELVKTQSELTSMRDEQSAAKAQIQELQKRLDMLETNVKGTVDMQKVMADYGAKTDQLSTDIQLLQGKLEENNFRIGDLAQKLDDKSFKITELAARLDDLDAKFKSLQSGSAGIATGASGSAPGKDPKTAAKSVGPSEAYRQAMNDYNSGNFDLALAGFQNYLVQFLGASQADHAQYWVGECFYAEKKYAKAIEAFSKVLKDYPKSEKVPGAKLKIGYSYLKENNHAKTREWLNKVIKEYPGTKEAELAKDKLRKIGK